MIRLDGAGSHVDGFLLSHQIQPVDAVNTAGSRPHTLLIHPSSLLHIFGINVVN